MLQVAYQGEPGAFSEAAAIEHFGNSANPVARDSFEAVFDCVTTGECDLGFIPIENSVNGSIHRNYDLLLQHDLYIISEYHLRIQHCLIARPEATLADIKRVISHPQGLGQCRQTLPTLVNAKPETVYDTAGAVKMVAAGSDIHLAAIASRRAAEIYGMNILAEGIEDNPSNFTRFLTISRSPVQPQGATKTTIVFSLKHQPGALYQALAAFANHDIDLTKIESRPLIGRPWEYLFYIDFAGACSHPETQKAIKMLETETLEMRVFGSYPRNKAF
ncbi:MAG: prephenate dehydratase [Anaerolineaceae bacterium]|jgi:prephenate dehydratase|nr:prephenate dehydratase [Anaerolineaceae bacterium]